MPSARSASAGLVLAFLVASGALSQDCNSNGIPDPGEIESGLAPDCNGNRIPDVCDIEPTIAFGPGARVDIGGMVTPPVIADLDGDGDLDIALARRARGPGTENPEPPRLVVLRNSGDGSFTQDTAELLDDPTLVIAGDFDGDRDVDLAAIMNPGLRILHNRGDGAFVSGPFQDRSEFPVDGTPLDADVDGDLDLAVLAGDAVTVLFNTGSGTFPYRSSYAVAGGNSGSVSVVDEPRDQVPDLFVHAGSAREVLQNLGDGTFQNVSLLLSPTPTQFGTELAQLDGRHGLDAVTGLRAEVRVDLRAENGTFPFSARFPIPPGERINTSPTSVIAFRVDGDFDLDVAMTQGGTTGSNPVSGMTTVFANDGEGNLRVAGTLPVEGTGLTTTDAADLDGDRDAEITIVNLQTGIVATWRNDSFDAASDDANRDGVPDECSGGRFRRGDADENSVLDLTDAQFLLDHLYRGGMTPRCLDAADGNDDGLLDLGDPIYILNHLFLGGPPPPAPGPPPMPCGPDPDGSEKLGCSRYNPC